MTKSSVNCFEEIGFAMIEMLNYCLKDPSQQQKISHISEFDEN